MDYPPYHYQKHKRTQHPDTMLHVACEADGCTMRLQGTLSQIRLAGWVLDDARGVLCPRHKGVDDKSDPLNSRDLD